MPEPEATNPGVRNGHDARTPSAPVLVRAVSMLPSGLYLMTSAYEGERAGMLIHAVLPASSDPPLIVVAARKGHAIDPVIRDARCFAVGLVDPGDRLVRKSFAFGDSGGSGRGEHPLSDPFDPFPARTLVTGSPILDRCPLWLDCVVVRHVELEAEHELFVGQVVGARIDEGDPRG